MKVRHIAVLSAAVFFITACMSNAESDTPAEIASHETREIHHARGVTEVPTEPQRVVVLESVQIDTAVALEANLVGAAIDAPGMSFSPYLGLEDVQEAGDIAEPNLEKIASLQPDLIMGTDLRHHDLYDKLSEIAPTVFMATQDEPWQDSVRFIGAVLGEEEKAERLLDDYKNRCDSIREKFDTDGLTANVLRPIGTEKIRIHNSNSFSGSIVECVGLTIPEQEWSKGNGIGLDISQEYVMSTEADYVFYTTLDIDNPQVPEMLSEASKTFPKVYPVDSSYWISGVGPKGAQEVLNDLETLLQSS